MTDSDQSPGRLSGLIARAKALALAPSGIYLGAAVLARVGSFLLIPVYTRHLSLEEYGRYSIFLILVAGLASVSSLGLVSAIPRFYFASEEREAGRGRAGEVARWLVAVSLGAAVLGTGLAWWLLPKAGTGLSGRWSVACALLASSGMSIGAVPATLLRAEQRPYSASAFLLLQFVAVSVAGLALVLGLKRGYQGCVEAVLLANALVGLAGGVFTLSLPGRFLPLETLREATAFSLPFIPHFLAHWLLGAADRWVLQANGYKEEVGGYSLAIQVVTPMSMVVSAWNDGVAPRMGESYRAGGIPELAQEREGLWRSYLLAHVLPGVALVVALPLIALVVGPAFRSSLLLVPFILLSQLPDVLYYSNFHTVYYGGKTRVLAVATVLAAAANLLGNLLLVPGFGCWGAIAARLAGSLVRAGIVKMAAGHKIGPLE